MGAIVGRASVPRCPRCKGGDIRVVHYRCHYSAFNGYRCTPSDFSRVVCLDCGHQWRTKARWVDHLTQVTDEELDNAGRKQVWHEHQNLEK